MGVTVDRISVPYFWNPRLDAVIAPIDPLPPTLHW
jgi:isopenicillin N synthase-like dioxygenase